MNITNLVRFPRCVALFFNVWLTVFSLGDLYIIQCIIIHIKYSKVTSEPTITKKKFFMKKPI